MNVLAPGFAGRTEVASPDAAFLEGMKARVQVGLLEGRPHWRSRYEVTRHAPRELTFRASDVVTAINVGLNEVTLRTTGDRGVEYLVTYGRWAAYVVGLGAVIGLALISGFLFRDVETYAARYVFAADPALNTTVGLWLSWGFVLFWALVWPWILIVMHRRFARKLLDRLIREVDIAVRQAPAADAPRSAQC